MTPYKYEFKVDANPRLAWYCFEQLGPDLYTSLLRPSQKSDVRATVAMTSQHDEALRCFAKLFSLDALNGINISLFLSQAQATTVSGWTNFRLTTKKVRKNGRDWSKMKISFVLVCWTNLRGIMMDLDSLKTLFWNVFTVRCVTLVEWF